MNRNKRLIQTGNIYLYLILKVLLAVVMLQITQLLFYYFNTRHFIVEGSEWIGILWGNVRYGFVTVVTFLLPFLVLNLIPFNFRWNRGFNILSEVLYLIPVLVVLGLNMVDTSYFQFTYRRMSAEMFAYMGIGGDMGNLLPHFIVDYWYSVVSGLGIMALFVWMGLNIRLSNRHNSFYSQKSTDCVGSIISLMVVFVLFRGGFQRNFIQLSDVSKYCQFKNTPLVSNSPYNILRTLGHLEFKGDSFCATGESDSLFSSEFVPLALKEKSAPKSGLWCYGAGHLGTMPPISDIAMDTTLSTERYKNIVVIILESFSQEYMGMYNEGKSESFTPFLDSLSEYAFVYQGMSNGKKSIESIPAVLASTPTLMDVPFILSSYYDNQTLALPAILKKHDYSTAFFHGSYNGSMKFDDYCSKIGFDSYYGRTEYGDDSDWDHTWGIFDEPFLQFMARKITTMREPFFTTVFTISSHHPYTIPEQHKGRFKKGEHPILECVNYADYALRQFFSTASQQPWFENTLFVITADHPAQGLSPEYNNYDTWYKIPMIFYDPSSTKGFKSDRIVQQIDLMPTLIDYLGLKDRAVCFGNSLFQQSEGYQVAYGNGYYQLVNKNGVVVMMGNKVEYHSRSGEKDECALSLLKSILQQYQMRMMNDQLRPMSKKTK